MSENLPSDNFYNSDRLKTGYGSTSGRNRTFISFELPDLDTAEMVTAAQLFLWLYNDNFNNEQINAHKVLGSWDANTINWNNQPSYDSKIVDYQLISGNSGENFAWNITNIVKDWYSNGNNYGLMLKNNNESGAYYEFYSSDIHDAHAEGRPQIILNYVNNSGLESYWTYHSQEVGRAGTGYINDYNGNLVFIHNDVSMNGNRMPLNLNHVFNSNVANGNKPNKE